MGAEILTFVMRGLCSDVILVEDKNMISFKIESWHRVPSLLTFVLNLSTATYWHYMPHNSVTHEAVSM